MKIEFKSYPFTPILGWSSSRFEMFQHCKREYFYNYYPRFAPATTSFQELKDLKKLTSVPLEVGNVIHHVLEEFLKRTQKSAQPINRTRFIQFGEKLCDTLFQQKEFIEVKFGYLSEIDTTAAKEKISRILTNFLESDLSKWILSEAPRSSHEWVIEPNGFGETRIDGVKAYCKMDFLLPVGDEVHILDWKSGKKHETKHSQQLLGYALATQASNPSIPSDKIIPRVIYLYPEMDELNFEISDGSIAQFKADVKQQTQDMYGFCTDIDQNKPLPFSAFPKTEATQLCRYCPFQEVCRREA